MSNYSVPLYSAISEVNTLHNLARFKASNEIPGCDATASDACAEEFKVYFTGVAVVPVCMVVVFIIWSIALCCPCCRRCSKACTGSHLTNFRVLFIVLALGALASLSMSWYGGAAFELSFNDVVDNGVSFANIFKQGAENGELGDAALAAGIVAAKSIDQGACLGNAGAEVQAAVQSLESAQAELQAYLVEIDDVALLLDDVNEQTAQISSWIGPTTLSFLGLLTLFFALYVVAAIYASCDQRPHGVFEGCMRFAVFPLTLFTIFLVAILCALVMTLGIVSADFCVDPDAMALSLVNASAATSADVAQHYITCEGDNPFLVLSTDGGSLLDVSADVAQVNEDVAAQRDSLIAACGADDTAAIDAILGTTATCLALVEDTIELVRCPGLTPLYIAVVHEELCASMFKANVQFFGGVSFACLLLMTMLSFRSVYSTDHEETEGQAARRKSAEMTGTQFV